MFSIRLTAKTHSLTRVLLRAGLTTFTCVLLAVIAATPALANEIVLHNFAPISPHGANPSSGVIRDSAGNLYGTTSYGGSSNAGVVYKVEPTGHLAVLYSFTGGADGGNPNAGVIADSAGNLYGTTVGGGSSACFNGCGVVYTVDTTGHETVLHSFSGADGGNPQAGVIRDSAGNLYGTTKSGGTSTYGVVFEIAAADTAQ